MQLFKDSLLVAIISFAKVSIYLFEQEAQKFPSSRYTRVCDEISVLQRNWISYVIKATRNLYDIKCQKYVFINTLFNRYFSHFH